MQMSLDIHIDISFVCIFQYLH